jgi:hypothetical protein
MEGFPETQSKVKKTQKFLTTIEFPMVYVNILRDKEYPDALTRVFSASY